MDSGRGAGDRDHDRRLGQHPGQRHLLRRNAPGVRHLSEGSVPVPRSAALPMPPNGLQGRNAMPRPAQWASSGSLLRKAGETGSARWPGAPPSTGGRCRSARCWRWRCRRCASSPRPAGPQRADGVRVGHLRVGPVELVQADRVDAERLERRLGGLPRCAGEPSTSTSRRRPQVAALGGDQHVAGIAAVAGQRLAMSRSLCPISPSPGGRRPRCRSG